MTKKRWLRLSIAGVLAICIAVGTILVVRHTNAPRDDCAVAAEVFQIWTSLSASLTAMVTESGGDKASRAAEAESEAADQIRTKAADISSSNIKLHALGLADALDRIAKSQISPTQSQSDPLAGPDPAYMEGSAAATAAAGALRNACPSIPRSAQQ